MTVQPPTPIADGTLSKTPLAHVLVNIALRRLTGTLAVWPDPQPEGNPPRGQDRVRFEDGTAVSMRPLEPVANMDRALGALFVRHQAPYAFYDADLVGSGPEVLTGRIDPFALVARALRGPADDRAVDAVLDKLGDAALEVRADAPIERFELEPDEQQVLEHLRQPAPVGRVLEEAPDRATARRVLYLLVITRFVEASTPPRSPSSVPTDRPAPRPATPPPAGSPPPAAVSSPPPSSGSRPVPEDAPRSRRSSRAPAEPEPPPAPPDELSLEMRRRWKAIADRARTLEDQTFFDMLGVDRADGASTVRDAYFEQVKSWHPDRLPPELQPLRPWVERIFHYVTEARDVLSDPEERAQYVKAVQGGGGTPRSERQVDAIVGAAIEFQKVEVYARRRSWDEALAVLDDALELNPREADFHAMRAWLLFQKHGADESSPVQDILQATDKALSLDPNCVRAHYTKGVILKRLGKVRPALAHFTKVTQLDPKHIEAAREVRLAEMRSRHSAAPPPAEPRPSFLSKLFGGKKK